MAELRTVTITETFKVDDVLTDLDAVPAFTAEDAGESGVIRVQDGTVVVAAGTTLPKIATGTYQKTFTESPNSYTYNYWIKWTYDGETYYDEHTIRGASAAITTRTAYKAYADISGTDDDALLDDLVARASSAIEGYCDRKFNYDTYRERYDGDGTTELVIKQYPIGQVTMLSVGTTDVIQFTNVNADAWNVYVSVSSTTMALVIQGGTNDGSDSLTLTDYTITTLVAAINALGKGWSAAVQLSDYGVWDASELMPCSAKECLDSYAYLDCPNEPASEYKVYSDVGTIYLPTGFSSGAQNIIVRYTAGFSTMPDDLVQITLDLVNVYYKSRKTDSTVKAEKLGDHAITYAAEGGGGARDIPSHIRRRLAPYKRWSRLGVA